MNIDIILGAFFSFGGLIVCAAISALERQERAGRNARCRYCGTRLP